MNFSRRTEEAITSGKLTKSCRIEVVQALAASVMIHTLEPSSEQYNTVCKKLIDAHPNLKDDVPNTSGYVS